MSVIEGLNQTWRRALYVTSAALLLLASGCPRHEAPALSYNEGSAAELRQLLQAVPKESDGAGAASAAEPTGWGALKGKFNLEGAGAARAAGGSRQGPAGVRSGWQAAAFGNGCDRAR